MLPNDVFIEVVVQPVYGQFRSVISWRVKPQFSGGAFVVKKSPTGMGAWINIGSGNGLEFAVDDDLISQGALLSFYYQVSVTVNGQTYESPITSTFGTYSRYDYGVARRIMNLEHLLLRQFTKVWVYKLKIHAPDCPVCIDPDTQQAIGLSLCTNCYSTRRDGGYWEPIVSYMRWIQISPVQQVNSQEMTGTRTPINSVARFLAFPKLRNGDMILDSGADRRFLVDSVEYSYVGGKIPVVAMANLDLLSPDDIRYQIVVPTA